MIIKNDNLEEIVKITIENKDISVEENLHELMVARKGIPFYFLDFDDGIGKIVDIIV